MSFTIFYIKKTPFQAIKTRSLKNRKILFFQRVIFPTFLGGAIQARKMSFRIFQNVQKRPLFQLFFQAIKNRKMSFTIFQNEKTPFQAIKTRSSKSPKVDIFPKGLTHGFGPKMAIFPTFIFLGNKGQENVFYDMLERENAFVGYKNKKSKKLKN